MAKEKKSTSCLGLFMRGFIITSLVLANLGVAGVMVAVKFLDADYATWTDFGSYSSYPWMMIFGILGIGAGIGLLMGLVGAAVSLAFGGDKKSKKGSKRSSSRARPQSNRKTTI
jgi:hypothetical protein